ncbi:hypothetical protein ACO0LO_29140, partial [Undibacterium sp. TJN25]|uniref:hypothetical protein n=1 Tax=Undibacterium sp. TJN25 TaxID=3413056 RepID=UPI003BF1185C
KPCALASAHWVMLGERIELVFRLIYQFVFSDPCALEGEKKAAPACSFSASSRVRLQAHTG